MHREYFYISGSSTGWVFKISIFEDFFSIDMCEIYQEVRIYSCENKGKINEKKLKHIGTVPKNIFPTSPPYFISGLYMKSGCDFNMGSLSPNSRKSSIIIPELVDGYLSMDTDRLSSYRATFISRDKKTKNFIVSCPRLLGSYRKERSFSRAGESIFKYLTNTVAKVLRDEEYRKQWSVDGNRSDSWWKGL